MFIYYWRSTYTSILDSAFNIIEWNDSVFFEPIDTVETHNKEQVGKHRINVPLLRVDCIRKLLKNMCKKSYIKLNLTKCSIEKCSAQDPCPYENDFEAPLEDSSVLVHFLGTPGRLEQQLRLDGFWWSNIGLSRLNERFWEVYDSYSYGEDTGKDTGTRGIFSSH